MYKLVAIDLDGTLVTDEKELTKKTIEVIKEISKQGVKVMISSGRAFYRLEKFIDALDLRKENQCTICFNGGIIVENTTKELLYSRNLDAKEVEELIQLGKALRLPIMIYTRDTHYVEAIPEVVRKNTKNLKGMNLKVVNFNQLNKKSEAIKVVMEKYNIKRDEVMAIGDGENDIEMLDFAGLGIAMENASDFVKEFANDVTTSNNQDGVANAIEKYILREK